MVNERSTTSPLLQKIFIILVISIGIFVNVFLLGTVTILNPKAAPSSTPEILFNPQTASIPPDTTIQIIIDPKGEPLSFADIHLHFDTNVIRLNSEISTSGSPLTGTLGVSSMSDANSTGIVRIGSFLQPGRTGPSSAFTLATLSFTSGTSRSGQPTDITIIDEPTQLVGATGPELNFTTRTATINAATGRNPARGGLVRPISEILSGNCGSTDFIDTAIGCIPKSDTQALAEFFLSWGLGIGGGIALIMIVYSGYLTMTSSGDPRKLQSGKELLTASISGLMLLVLGAFLLRVIGVDILQIPGF